jgi:hypothetical protein
MKTQKSILVALVTLLAAGLLSGAKDVGNDRPAHVEAGRWIQISGTAGVALTDELAATRQLAGQLYVRTEKGWRVVSILNPAGGQLLDERITPRR